MGIYKNTLVVLDDKQFVDCTITDCMLEYGGHEVLLETTTFSGCRFLFAEDPGRTVALLQQFRMIASHLPVPQRALDVN